MEFISDLWDEREAFRSIFRFASFIATGLIILWIGFRLRKSIDTSKFDTVIRLRAGIWSRLSLLLGPSSTVYILGFTKDSLTKFMADGESATYSLSDIESVEHLREGSGHSLLIKFVGEDFPDRWDISEVKQIIKGHQDLSAGYEGSEVLNVFRHLGVRVLDA